MWRHNTHEYIAVHLCRRAPGPRIGFRHAKPEIAVPWTEAARAGVLAERLRHGERNRRDDPRAVHQVGFSPRDG